MVTHILDSERKVANRKATEAHISALYILPCDLAGWK
jgi:hypothetical protein